MKKYIFLLFLSSTFQQNIAAEFFSRGFFPRLPHIIRLSSLFRVSQLSSLLQVPQPTGSFLEVCGVLTTTVTAGISFALFSPTIASGTAVGLGVFALYRHLGLRALFNARIDEVQTTAKKNHDEMRAQFRYVQGRIESSAKENRGNFTDVQKKITVVDKKIDAVQGSIDQVSDDLEEVGRQLDGTEKRLTQQINGVEMRVVDKIGAVQTDVSTQIGTVHKMATGYYKDTVGYFKEIKDQIKKTDARVEEHHQFNEQQFKLLNQHANELLNKQEAADEQSAKTRKQLEELCALQSQQCIALDQHGADLSELKDGVQFLVNQAQQKQKQPYQQRVSHITPGVLGAALCGGAIGVKQQKKIKTMTVDGQMSSGVLPQEVAISDNDLD